MELTPDLLVSQSLYGAVRDLSHHEFVVLTGAALSDTQVQATLQRFAAGEALPRHHTRLSAKVGDLAVWLDPTRPELWGHLSPPPVIGQPLAPATLTLTEAHPDLEPLLAAAQELSRLVGATPAVEGGIVD